MDRRGFLKVMVAAPALKLVPSKAFAAFEEKALALNASCEVVTAGTSIDFTGIPAGVRKVIVSINEVFVSGMANLQVQIGDSGGIESSGYSSCSTDGQAVRSHSSGFRIANLPEAATLNGTLILSHDGNAWVATCTTVDNKGGMHCSSGVKEIQEIDRLRLTTDGAVEAGAINISYEL